MIFPKEFKTHAKGAWRESLLALRGLLDHWIQHVEGKGGEDVGTQAPTGEESQPRREEKV